jgi:hypothetical protein
MDIFLIILVIIFFTIYSIKLNKIIIKQRELINQLNKNNNTRKQIIKTQEGHISAYKRMMANKMIGVINNN